MRSTNQRINASTFLGLLVAALSFFSCAGEGSKTPEVNQAALVTQTFPVWGNCGMCEKTIEGSLKVDGIASASWDRKAKTLAVTYDTTRIDLDRIQQNVAAAGYDNDRYFGDDEAYSKLPECCQYDRKNRY